LYNKYSKMDFQNDEDWGFFIDLELDNFYYPHQENISQHESLVNYKTVIDIREIDEYNYDYPPQPIKLINVTHKKKQEPTNLMMNVFLICIIVYAFNLLNFIFN